jgi:hypothetical protein
MSSLYSSDNPYFLEGPAQYLTYSYTEGSVMNYIYKNSQVAALVLQTARLDKFADNELFKSTLFIPSKNYCVKYKDNFKGINFDDARKIMFANIVGFELNENSLRGNDFIPKLDGNFINLKDTRVNCLIQCSNGVIIILDGFLT